MSVQDDYRAKHPKSARAGRAAPARRFPAASPTTSATWSRSPSTSSARPAARKWDADGHEYVDYWMGHGSLFLGHCHPAVVKAVQEQMARGTHMGACHAAEVRWAELVNQLIPERAS